MVLWYIRYMIEYGMIFMKKYVVWKGTIWWNVLTYSGIRIMTEYIPVYSVFNNQSWQVTMHDEMYIYKVQTLIP